VEEGRWRQPGRESFPDTALLRWRARGRWPPAEAKAGVGSGPDERTAAKGG